MKKNLLIAFLMIFIGWGANAQTEYNITQASEDGTPSFITFYSNSNVTHLNFLEKLKKDFKIRKEDGLSLIKATSDKLGFTQFKYNQTYNGITVFGAQYIIVEKNNLATTANGKFISNLKINTTPTITKDEAIKSAMKTIGLNKYRWEDSKSEEAIKSRTKNKNASYYPKPELVIAPIDGNYKNGKFCLCWKFNVAGLSLTKAWTVFVDAKTGKLVNKISMVADDATATATTLYNGTQSIKCTDDTGASGYYLLSESQRGASLNQSIYTWSANNDTIIHINGNVPTATTQIGSATSSFTGDPAANNIHWGIEKSYDFYELFGRHSFDNNGTYILNLAHYDANMNNAFWSGYDTVMCYGDGDGSYMNAVVGLDVEGHEFSHAITEYSAALQYQGESGALNESFSDIFGTGIEWYTLGAGSNWTIGEDVMITEPYLRSMSNPNAAPGLQPDTYLQSTFWAPTGSSDPDAGGVHTNSGVQNYWFYLLVNGGTGVNHNGVSYSVTGIGMSDALNVVYRNLTVYLTNSSQYSDARLGSIQAATDFWGAGSQQVQSVTAAWCAVGLGTCSSGVAGVMIARTAGSNPTCAGSSVTFTATPTNGGATPSYQWKVNGVVKGTNSQTFTTTTLTNGQVVTCVMTSNLAGVTGNPATSSGITMNVNAIPSAPTVTVTNNCGNSVLSTTATGTLLWSNGASTASITVTAAGVKTVTQTAGGCTSTAGSGTAAPKTVPSTPTISQSGAVLTSSSATGNQWYLNGSVISAATNQTYTATQNGNYTVGVTSNGCASNVSAQVNVSIGTTTQVCFNSATNYGAGTTPYSICSSDFNGDGLGDLALANSGSGNISVLLGTGAGNFGAAINYTAGTTPWSINSNDVNGDGFKDLIVANSGSNNVSVLLGNGAGSFGTATNFSAGTNPSSVISVDFNGDGFLDLAVANANSSNVSILLGTGTGSFGTATNFSAGGVSTRWVTNSDFNGDGFTDLVVANLSSNNVAVLLGNGTGSFGAANNFTVGTNPTSVVTADFNGDGVKDLAVANYGSNNVSVLLGTGTGSFGTAANFPAGTSSTTITASDFNGDGIKDLAVANYGSNNLSVLLGTGTGSFGAAINFVAGTGTSAIINADLNGDGKADLATANQGGTASILLNCFTTTGGVLDIDNEQKIVVYPNPFSRSITFSSKTNLVNATLLIYDVLGQETKRVINISGPLIDINRGDMINGIYFYVITQDDRIIGRGKLIAE